MRMSSIQAGTLFLFCFLLLILPLPSTPTTIYVTPTPQTPCPGKPCYTLSQYAHNASQYLVSNTTMTFLPGEHSLKLQVNVSHADNFSMVNESEGTSTIVCSGSKCGGFYFENTSPLVVSGLNFVSDNHSIIAEYVHKFLLVDCTFSSGGNTALFAKNSNLLLRGNTFQGNVGRGDIQTTLSPGCGIAILSSNMTLQGQNMFLNNSCSDYICGGSAIYAENSEVDLVGNTSFINNTVMNTIHSDVISGGGGILFYNSTVNITGHVNFINNSVTNAYVSGSTCQIGGGGASLLFCKATIGGEVIFSNNFATGKSGCGGGLYSLGGSVVISGSVEFTNNYAGLFGGGISEVGGSMAIFGTVSLTNNTAARCGGGLSMQGTTVNITGNAAFTDNSAIYAGGGIYLQEGRLNISGTVSLTNNTANSREIAMLKGTIDTPGIIFSTSNYASHIGGRMDMSKKTLGISNTVSLDNNSRINSTGGGLAMYNGTIDITGSVLFSDNYAYFSGGGIGLEGGSMTVSGTVSLISNSAGYYGGGLNMLHNNMYITESGCVLLTENYAGPTYQEAQGGGWNMQSCNVNISGTVSVSNNSVFRQGGGIAIIYSNMFVSGSMSVRNNSAPTTAGGILIGGSNITISNALVTDNCAYEGGGIVGQGSNIVVTGSVLFSNNSATYNGGGIVLIESSFEVSGNVSLIKNSALTFGGGIVIKDAEVFVTGHILLNDNSAGSPGFVGSDGGGIYMEINSIMTVNGTVSLVNNSATQYGGGITFLNSRLAIAGKVYFTGNSAPAGGAIYVSDTTSLVYCSSDVSGAECIIEDCFFQNLSLSLDTLMVFDGNVAQYGSVLMGGSIDRCTLEGQVGVHSGEVFDAITNYSKQPPGDTESVISSNPFRVCLCENNHPNCGDRTSVTVYPGQTFSINAVAVGQRNGAILATINAVTSAPEHGRLGVFEDRQHITQCTKLHYTFFSNAKEDTLTLYVDGSCSSLDGSKERLNIPIHLRDCPPAFNLSETQYGYGCVCEERLQKFTNSCNINNQTILRDGDFWVGYDNTSTSKDLILHPHCPSDYCQVKPINFSLAEIDLQCQHNRTGLLCGACTTSLSLALGSSKCLRCSDTYLLLLLPFAVMGFVLVLFLLIFIFTVRIGTISGLIFYANIVGANQNIFFPPGSKNYLGNFIFVSWIKLDLGIETCFYDGMDMYAKTWLQFVFPIYMCGLIPFIILFKKCFPETAKKFHNAEDILATIFIMSYGKILHAIIIALSYTTLEYPTGEAEMVWLYDANIRFLHGKHISLFVVSVLLLAFVYLPVTLLLLLGQLLELSPKTSPVVNILKVFYCPYNEYHRYWPGLLLVIRLALLLVSGLNASRNYSENLLAISAAAFLLLAWPWMLQDRVYKKPIVGVLEGAYMLNLGIFAVATFYVQQAGGNQATVAYISTGVAIATFIVTVLYHIYLHTKELTCWEDRCPKPPCWNNQQPPQDERPLDNTSSTTVP